MIDYLMMLLPAGDDNCFLSIPDRIIRHNLRMGSDILRRQLRLFVRLCVNPSQGLHFLEFLTVLMNSQAPQKEREREILILDTKTNLAIKYIMQILALMLDRAWLCICWHSSKNIT